MHCLCFAQRDNCIANLDPSTVNYARCDSAVTAHSVVSTGSKDRLHARARSTGPGHLQKHLITNPNQSPVAGEGRVKSEQVDATDYEVASQLARVDAFPPRPRSEKWQVLGLDQCDLAAKEFVADSKLL